MLHELGWIVAAGSLVLNMYQMHRAWKAAQVLDRLEELRVLIEEYAEGRDHEPSMTR